MQNENVEAIHRFLDVPGVKFNIRNLGGVLFYFLEPLSIYLQISLFNNLGRRWMK